MGIVSIALWGHAVGSPTLPQARQLGGAVPICEPRSLVSEAVGSLPGASCAGLGAISWVDWGRGTGSGDRLGTGTLVPARAQ